MDKPAVSPALQEAAGAESVPEADVVAGGADGRSSGSPVAVAEYKRKRDELEAEEQPQEAVNGESAAVESTKNEADAEPAEIENGTSVEEHEEKVVTEEAADGAATVDAKRQRLDEDIHVSGSSHREIEIESEVENGHIQPPEDEKNAETATEETIQDIAPAVSPQKTVPSDVQQQTPEGQPSARRIEVPNNKVGVLIGKSGETIRFLQFNTGAKIQIMRDAEADPNAPSRPVELIGTLESINKAEKLIKDVIAEADAGGSPALVARGFGASQFGAEQLQIQIPNEKVGLIIGKGGETIKNLQTRSRARIQLIPQHLPEGDVSKERTVRITGNKEQIEAAIDLIKQLMDQVPVRSSVQGGYTQPTQQRYRGPTPAQWAPRVTPPAQPISSYNYPSRGPYQQTQGVTHYAAYSRPSISRAPTWDQSSSAPPVHYRQSPPASAPVSGGYYGQPPPPQHQVYGQQSVTSHYQQSYAKPAYGGAPPRPAPTAQHVDSVYGSAPPSQPQPQQQTYPYGTPAAYQQYAAAPPGAGYAQYSQPAAPVYGTPSGAYGQYPAAGYGEQPVQDNSGYGFTAAAAAPVATEAPYGNNLYGMQPPAVGYEQNAAAASVSGGAPAGGYVQQQYAQP